jgi:hypothetical protein
VYFITADMTRVIYPTLRSDHIVSLIKPVFVPTVTTSSNIQLRDVTKSTPSSIAAKKTPITTAAKKGLAKKSVVASPRTRRTYIHTKTETTTTINETSSTTIRTITVTTKTSAGTYAQSDGPSDVKVETKTKITPNVEYPHNEYGDGSMYNNTSVKPFMQSMKMDDSLDVNPNLRNYLNGVAVYDKLFLFGNDTISGSNDTVSSSGSTTPSNIPESERTVMYLDLITHKWLTLSGAVMKVGRRLPSVVWCRYNDMIYIINGDDNGTVEVFDPILLKFVSSSELSSSSSSESDMKKVTTIGSSSSSNYTSSSSSSNSSRGTSNVATPTSDQVSHDESPGSTVGALVTTTRTTTTTTTTTKPFVASPPPTNQKLTYGQSSVYIGSMNVILLFWSRCIRAPSPSPPHPSSSSLGVSSKKAAKESKSKLMKPVVKPAVTPMVSFKESEKKTTNNKSVMMYSLIRNEWIDVTTQLNLPTLLMEDKRTFDVICLSLSSDVDDDGNNKSSPSLLLMQRTTTFDPDQYWILPSGSLTMNNPNNNSPPTLSCSSHWKRYHLSAPGSMATNIIGATIAY